MHVDIYGKLQMLELLWRRFGCVSVDREEIWQLNQDGNKRMDGEKV